MSQLTAPNPLLRRPRKLSFKLPIQRWLSIDQLAIHLPYFLFVALLIVIYIGNIHTVETTYRSVEKLKKEVEISNWYYVKQRKELMMHTTESEIEKRVQSLGLKPLTTPPTKIMIPSHEYQ